MLLRDTAPMRIAVDATSLLGHRSGIGRFVAALLTELGASTEVDPIALALTWRGRDRLPSEVPEGVSPCSRWVPARVARSMWKRTDHPTIEWLTGPVDLVHGANFVVPPARAATELMTIHDLTPLRFPHLCTSDTIEYPDFIRRALDRGSHVHAPTRAVGEEVIRYFDAERDRVHVVAHGVDPIAEIVDAESLLPTAGRPFVLFIGTLEPRKGVPRLIEAFDLIAPAIPDHLLVLTGAPGWGGDAIDRALADSTHRSRVLRTGPVDDRQRAALLRSADVLAYPSVYEGFGLPPLEAMSVGTPVVASDDPAIRETSDGGALLTPIGDVEALARGIASVIEDEALRSSLIRRGHAVAAGRSWPDAVGELIELYRLLID